MEKQNILVFDDNGYFYGSTQKLLRLFAKILSKKFNVYFAGGPITDPAQIKELETAGVHIVPFTCTNKQEREPFTLVGMQPAIMEIVDTYNIHCIYASVYAHYQFPINTVPASIPFVLISPFGHYTTNGNVFSTYVSGKPNAARLQNRGVRHVQLLYNPLEDFSSQTYQKPQIGEKVVFGRIGRSDNSIYDSIALRAYKKLEDRYGDTVSFIVVNPPEQWVLDAQSLGLKHMEFRPAITERTVLENFYREIDVLAHARKDGETVGIAIAEAMMAGNPIVTHRSHEHNDHFDILDATYAKWCEVDDVEGYFENMQWFVEHKQDIRRMGLLARNKALEIFGMEAQVPKILETFSKACARYRHGSFLGKVLGYTRLYWENFLTLPFYVGKLLTLRYPALYTSFRKLYHK